MLLDEYLKGFSPMRGAKVRKALETQQGFNGVFMLRHIWAEKAAADGRWVDWAKGRVYAPNGCFFDVSAVTKTAAEYLEFCRQSAR